MTQFHRVVNNDSTTIVIATPRQQLQALLRLDCVFVYGASVTGTKSNSKAGAKHHESVLFPAGLLHDGDSRTQSSQSSHKGSCHDVAHGQKPSALVETLSPGQVWIIQNFLSAQECQAWIDHAAAADKSQVSGLGILEHVQQRGTRYMAARECHRAQRHDATMAHRLYERLIERAPRLLENDIAPFLSHTKTERPVTFNPNIRLYKYEKGMHFGKHVDDSNVVPGVGTTRLTVLVYLSECQGGATRFFGTAMGNDNGHGRHEIAFCPVVGAMLLHVHGDLCLEHQGDAVVAGTKWILRTDIVYAPVSANK